MTARIRDNQFKGAIILLLFIVLTLKAFVAEAQSSGAIYKGFLANFGTRSITVSSNIAKIDQTNLMETGGQVGLIYGNNLVKTKLGLFGYYASAGNTAGTTTLYTSSVALNLYPLHLISKRYFRVEPYLTGGVAYDRFHFFGYYVNKEPGITNYSQAEAPFLGKIKQVNASVGLGLELKLKDEYDFIHVFTEIKYARGLSDKVSDEVFSHTTLLDQMHALIGISFGANR